MSDNDWINAARIVIKSTAWKLRALLMAVACALTVSICLLTNEAPISFLFGLILGGTSQLIPLWREADSLVKHLSGYY
jgi:hypothetical protein